MLHTGNYTCTTNLQYINQYGTNFSIENLFMNTRVKDNKHKGETQGLRNYTS